MNCAAPGCTKEARQQRRSGLCGMHEMRLTRHGELEPVTRKRGSNVTIEEHLRRNGRWEGECFVWARSTRGHMGYGQTRHNGRAQAVHRLVWELANGPVPAGMMVLHTCDNPPCYRIEHLYLGAAEENMRDMYSRRRAGYRGRDVQPQAKVTEEQVREMVRRREQEGLTQMQLAAEYGLHQTTVSDILRKHR